MIDRAIVIGRLAERMYAKMRNARRLRERIRYVARLPFVEARNLRRDLCYSVKHSRRFARLLRGELRVARAEWEPFEYAGIENALRTIAQRNRDE